MHDDPPIASADEMADVVGHAVKDRRTDLGLTQHAVAQMAGVSDKTFGELERGKGRSSDITLKKVSRALGWEPDHLSRLRHTGTVPETPAVEALQVELSASLELLAEYRVALEAQRAQPPWLAELVALAAMLDPDDLAAVMAVIRRLVLRVS